MRRLTTLLPLLLLPLTLGADENTSLASHLQDISVTIRAGYAQGSGVVISRFVKRNADDASPRQVNFVWTAAHVVDGLRRTRTVIEQGTPKTLIEFDRVGLVQEMVEDGQRVGETKLEAQVICYSDAIDGEDLALLRVLKTNILKSNTNFYLGETIPSIGTEVCHVGSLLGQMGANSYTQGSISQIGRIYGKSYFDQTHAPAFPGSSGGGVFFKQGPYTGQYVGMIVRGAGETFNLMVPVRRMRAWAQRVGVAWALDASLPMPTEEELAKIVVESGGAPELGRRTMEDTRRWAQEQRFHLGLSKE